MGELAKAARAFRVAIENTPSVELTVCMNDFPAGSCGDATLLLGYYLKTHGFGTFEYVLGMRGDHSHAWLRQGDIVVDITADQFPEVDTPVLVTDTSPWHNDFETKVLHEADFHVYDVYTVASLSAAYTAITKNLPVLDVS